MNKIKYQNFTIILVIVVFVISCGNPRSRTVVVIHPGNKLFAVGNPEIKYSSSGARLDYFIPGAILIFKTDYTIFKQKGVAGKAYQITRDSVLFEIGNIDTTLNDSLLMNQFLVYDIETQ